MSDLHWNWVLERPYHWYFTGPYDRFFLRPHVLSQLLLLTILGTLPIVMFRLCDTQLSHNDVSVIVVLIGMLVYIYAMNISDVMKVHESRYSGCMTCAMLSPVFRLPMLRDMPPVGCIGMMQGISIMVALWLQCWNLYARDPVHGARAKASLHVVICGAEALFLLLSAHSLNVCPDAANFYAMQFGGATACTIYWVSSVYLKYCRTFHETTWGGGRAR